MSSTPLIIRNSAQAVGPVPRERNGVVYTRRWVVDLMLELVGYTADRDLASLRATEPAAGDGSFVLAMVERLLLSCQRHDRSILEADDAMRAYELDPKSTERCREAVASLLIEHGVERDVATRLARTWVRTGDHLRDLDRLPAVDVVVGNPPYIRLEDIATERARAYRQRYATMIGRADTYVEFFEAALRQLKPGGVCAFIYAKRSPFTNIGGGNVRRGRTGTCAA